MTSLLAFLIAAVGLPRDTAPSGKCVIVQRSTVYRHPATDPYDLKNLYGFNHAPSVVALPDGRLLAAWFSGPFEASVHQAILGAYSADGGKTWTPAHVLQDFPRKSDFDPAFIVDGGRTWFFFSAGRHNRYPPVRDPKTEVGPDSFKTYARTSDDAGRTWSEPRVVGEKVFCRSNGIRLSTGELLLPVYESPAHIGGILKSTDGGRSWRHVGGIRSAAGAGEPSIAELPGGGVLMVLRTRDGFLWKTVSRDRGEAWAEPLRTDLVAATTSHSIFRTRSGRLVLVHNESPPPTRTNLNIRISSDEGATWGAPCPLAEAATPGKDEVVWSRQATYPSVAELRDGSLVVVWTDLSVADTEQYGDIRAARVRVE